MRATRYAGILFVVVGCRTPPPNEPKTEPAASTSQVGGDHDRPVGLESVHSIPTLGALKWTDIEGGPAPMLLSEPLSPQRGLEVWRALDADAERAQVQPVLVPHPWRREQETYPPPDFPASYEGLVAKREADRQDDRKLDPSWPTLAREREDLDALEAADLPETSPSSPFRFEVAEDHERFRLQRALESVRTAGDAAAVQRVETELASLDGRVQLLVVGSGDPGMLAESLNFGGWNGSPHSAHHGAMFARWREAYDARLVFADEYSLEFEVRRPPDTLEATRRLAWEQYIYCDVMFTEGDIPLPKMAVELHRATRWFFYWN